MRRRDFIAFTGAAAAGFALPRVAFAQAPAKVPRVALVGNALTPDQMVIGGDPNWTAFLEQMQSHGFVEGRTIVYERYRVPNDQGAKLMPPVIAAAPDLIYFYGTSGAALAAIAINKTIPMVALGTDLLGSGIVNNLGHPGGNITGLSTNAGSDQPTKMFALLAEAVPAAKRFGYVVSGANGRPLPEFQAQYDVVRAAAAKLGVTLTLALVQVGAATEANYAQAFAAMAANKVEAAHFGNDSTLNANPSIVAQLALAAKMPMISPYAVLADAGALLAYGTVGTQNARQCADTIALILAGAKPGDLPVLLPSVFDVVANLKTAKAIGVTIPSSVLIQATRVIE